MHSALLLAWVAGASVVAFVLVWVDKSRARRGQQRLRERTLLLAALVGGSPGLVAAMLLVRHKWRKSAFIAILLLVVALQGAAIGWLLAVPPWHA